MTFDDFITPADLLPLLRRLTQVEATLAAYVDAVDDDLATAQALKAAGIGSRTTLIQARASAPGVCEPGRIRYRKEGTKALYSRRSCIDYKLASRRYS